MTARTMNRRVPISISSTLIFGGFLNQFGWLFFGFGMIFVWLFVGNADYSRLYYWTGEKIYVQGIIIRSEETSASVDDVPVYANYYHFTTEDGVNSEGVSYATGADFDEGETVEIEYIEGKPGRSRIVGMRRAIFSPVVSFVIIFPMAGLGFIYFGLRKGIKARRLMKFGIKTTGKLVDKEQTNASVNDRPVYKLTFSFESEDGRQWKVSENTHLPELLQDDREESLLYDPLNPEYAVMIDSLPGSPNIDELNKITPKPLLKSLSVAILPVLSIIIHGTYALSLLL